MHAKKLPVIFRRFKEGDIIALFPGQTGTNDSSTCNSYQHIGQHGSASVNLSNATTPAKYAEYLPLLRELRQIGYRDMEVVKRFTAKHRQERERAINSA